MRCLTRAIRMIGFSAIASVVTGVLALAKAPDGGNAAD
jgi:hypothetical protein